MSRDVIGLHYSYGTWATAKIFDAAEQLSAEQRAIPGHAGHGSIHDTLRHMLEVHLRWHAWFDGSLPPDKAIQQQIDPATVPDLATLRTYWETLNGRTLEFIAASTEDDLNRDMLVETPWTPSRTVPLWALMLHVANHETQHRSEVAAMLTEHGSSPGYLDILFFILDPANDSI